MPVTVRVLAPYLPSDKAAAVAWDLQGFFLRELEEQNKSQDLNLSNDSTHTFPFLSAPHPGEWSHAPVPCQCKDQLTVWPFCADSNAIKCPAAGSGDSYTGWWNPAFIFGDFQCTKLWNDGRQSAKNCRKTELRQCWIARMKAVCLSLPWHKPFMAPVEHRASSIKIHKPVRVCLKYRVEEYPDVVLKLVGCFIHGTILKEKYSLKVTVFQKEVWSSDT